QPVQALPRFAWSTTEWPRAPFAAIAFGARTRTAATRRDSATEDPQCAAGHAPPARRASCVRAALRELGGIPRQGTQVGRRDLPRGPCPEITFIVQPAWRHDAVVRSRIAAVPGGDANTARHRTGAVAPAPLAQPTSCACTRSSCAASLPRRDPDRTTRRRSG